MNHFVGGKTVEELAADREELERTAHKARFHYIPKRKTMNTFRVIWNAFKSRLPKLKGNQNVRDNTTGRWAEETDRYLRKDEVTVETDKRKK